MGVAASKAPPGHLALAASCLRTLGRFPGFRLIGRAIKKRVLDGEYEAEITVHGRCRVSVSLGDFIGCELFCYGTHERRQTEFVRQFLSVGDVFVDVGAHIGYYSLLAATTVGESGRVVSIEPNPNTHRKLAHNVSLNSLENIHLWEVCASDTEGEVELHLGGQDNTGTTSLSRPENASGNSAVVRSLPLSKVLAEEGLEKIDVVKIDVEGAETQVLRGLGPFLEGKARPAFFIEIVDQLLESQGSSAEELFEFLYSRGYESFALDTGEAVRTTKAADSALTLFRHPDGR